MPEQTFRPTPVSQVIRKLQDALSQYGDYDVIIETQNGDMCDKFDFFFTREDISKKRGSRTLQYKHYPKGEKSSYIKIKLR